MFYLKRPNCETSFKNQDIHRKIIWREKKCDNYNLSKKFFFQCAWREKCRLGSWWCLLILYTCFLPSPFLPSMSTSHAGTLTRTHTHAHPLKLTLTRVSSFSHPASTNLTPLLSPLSRVRNSSHLNLSQFFLSKFDCLSKCWDTSWKIVSPFQI